MIGHEDTERSTYDEMETDTTEAHVRSKVVTQSPGQTRIIPHDQSAAYETEKSGLGVWEIILRVVCLVLLVALLIAASITLFAVNNLEDDADERGQEYENAHSYRGAAGWLVFLAVAAIVFHGVMIFIRILYLSSTIENYFSGYAFINALVCVIFGVSLFAGGIANAVYASDNGDVYNEHCTAGATSSRDIEVCENLETLYGSQAAATAFSFFSLIMFVLLFLITLISGIRKVRGVSTSQQGNDITTTPLYVPLQNDTW